MNKWYMVVARYFVFMVVTWYTVITCGTGIVQSLSNPAASVEAAQISDWPDTPAGQWARAFFKAYNSDGTEALEKFISEYYSESYLKENPLEEEIANINQLRGMTAKVQVHSAQAEGEFKVSVLVRSETVGWIQFEIELSSESPHDLTGMGVTPSTPPSTKKEDDIEEWQTLGDLLERIRLDAGMPGIAAAIVRDGKIVDVAICGVRCLDRTDPLMISDRLQLGSITKLMTAVMIARLVEEGALTWNKSVGEVLHDLQMRDEYRNITIEQLLSFRGGLPNLPTGGIFHENIFTMSHMTDMSPLKGRSVLVSQILIEAPVGEANAEHYSSSAYVVASYMAEQVTGKTWEELMKQLIFEPLGMESASFGWPVTESDPSQPCGHYGAPPDVEVQAVGNDPMGLNTYMAPAGGVCCSIEDFARYAIFHLEALQGRDQFVHAESVQRFWGSEKSENGEDRLLVFGTGGTFFAMAAFYPKSNYALVAVTNCGHFATECVNNNETTFFMIRPPFGADQAC
jgi:CubicO group peptidase (beta-lactamase class C family)